tara:strand:- start:742 stop:1191 length:450 start_codon:yes stop_codon:yes gene_type:complete
MVKFILPKTEKRKYDEKETASILLNMDKIIMFYSYKEITELLNFPHALNCNRKKCSFPYCARVKKFFDFTNVFSHLLEKKNIREKSTIINILRSMIIQEKGLRLKQERIKRRTQKKTISGHLHYMHQHLLYCHNKECLMPFCPNFKRNK